MPIDWIEEDWLDDPIVQVNDGGIRSGYNETGLSLAQAAADYAAHSPDKSPRQISVRQADANGHSNWQTFDINAPPLERLAWNQGWPAPRGGIQYADVLDNGIHFNAANPEQWTLEEIKDDYGSGFVEGTEVLVCENRTPHQVMVRVVSEAEGNGEWQEFTVP
jgi:hypothetical protein